MIGFDANQLPGTNILEVCVQHFFAVIDQDLYWNGNFAQIFFTSQL
jgi:hypothetical protein